MEKYAIGELWSAERGLPRCSYRPCIVGSCADGGYCRAKYGSGHASANRSGTLVRVIERIRCEKPEG